MNLCLLSACRVQTQAAHRQNQQFVLSHVMILRGIKSALRNIRLPISSVGVNLDIVVPRRKPGGNS
jgi:hypothetical protein